MTSKPAPGERYQTFDAFYPYYIHEHSNRTCRRIHVVGTALVIGVMGLALVTRNAWWLLAMPVARVASDRVMRSPWLKLAPM